MKTGHKKLERQENKAGGEGEEGRSRRSKSKGREKDASSAVKARKKGYGSEKGGEARAEGLERRWHGRRARRKHGEKEGHRPLAGGDDNSSACVSLSGGRMTAWIEFQRRGHRMIQP